MAAQQWPRLSINRENTMHTGECFMRHVQLKLNPNMHTALVFVLGSFQLYSHTGLSQCVPCTVKHYQP